MTLEQLRRTIAPTVTQVWSRKSGTEKLVTRVLMSLAALAAANSGYQLGIGTLASVVHLAAVPELRP